MSLLTLPLKGKAKILQHLKLYGNLTNGFYSKWLKILQLTDMHIIVHPQRWGF